MPAPSVGRSRSEGVRHGPSPRAWMPAEAEADNAGMDAVGGSAAGRWHGPCGARDGTTSAPSSSSPPLSRFGRITHVLLSPRAAETKRGRRCPSGTRPKGGATQRQGNATERRVYRAERPGHPRGETIPSLVGRLGVVVRGCHALWPGGRGKTMTERGGSPGRPSANRRTQNGPPTGRRAKPESERSERCARVRADAPWGGPTRRGMRFGGQGRGTRPRRGPRRHAGRCSSARERERTTGLGSKAKNRPRAWRFPKRAAVGR